jgi:hypothetical protein
MNQQKTPSHSRPGLARFAGPALVGLLVINIGFVSYSLTSRSGVPQAAPEIASTSAKVLHLEARLEALESRLIALQNRVDNPPLARPMAQALAAATPVAAAELRDVTDVLSTKPADPPEDFEAQAAQAKAETKAVRDALDEHLGAQEIDTEWAAAQEARILDDIGDGQLGRAYLVGSECRSNLCRVEIEHPESGQLDGVMFELAAQAAFAGRRLFIEQDTSGPTGRMTIYLARAGQPLPTDRQAL